MTASHTGSRTQPVSASVVRLVRLGLLSGTRAKDVAEVGTQGQRPDEIELDQADPPHPGCQLSKNRHNWCRCGGPEEPVLRPFRMVTMKSRKKSQLAAEKAASSQKMIHWGVG